MFCCSDIVLWIMLGDAVDKNGVARKVGFLNWLHPAP